MWLGPRIRPVLHVSGAEGPDSIFGARTSAKVRESLGQRGKMVILGEAENRRAALATGQRFRKRDHHARACPFASGQRNQIGWRDGASRPGFGWVQIPQRPLGFEIECGVKAPGIPPAAGRGARRSTPRERLPSFHPAWGAGGRPWRDRTLPAGPRNAGPIRAKASSPRASISGGISRLSPKRRIDQLQGPWRNWW